MAADHEQPVDLTIPADTSDYMTPFERAQEHAEHAERCRASLGRAADQATQAQLAYAAASFEMLNAMHEVLERLERNTRKSAADDAIGLMLPGIVESMYAAKAQGPGKPQQ